MASQVGESREERTPGRREQLLKHSVRISIYHHAMMAWLAWQEAEEAGDTERAEKAFRVYDFGFDLIGC